MRGTSLLVDIELELAVYHPAYLELGHIVQKIATIEVWGRAFVELFWLGVGVVTPLSRTGLNLMECVEVTGSSWGIWLEPFPDGVVNGVFHGRVVDGQVIGRS